MRRIWPLLPLLLLLALPVTAQETDTTRLPTIEEIRSDYEALRYQQVETKAEQALANYQSYAPSELVRLHTLLGFVRFTRNELGEARRNFEAALSIDPSLELDPVLVSPKIQSFFAEVKAQWRQRHEEELGAAEPAAIRYVPVPDQRFERVARSMILPGWGQYYSGERLKGATLMGAWSVAAGGAVVTQLLRSEARNDYLDARLDELDPAYDTLVRWDRVRNYFLLSAAAVWVISYTDAVIGGGEEVHRVRRARVVPWTGPATAGVRVQW